MLWHVLPTLCCSDGDVWSTAQPWQFLSTTSDCQLIMHLHLSLTLRLNYSTVFSSLEVTYLGLCLYHVLCLMISPKACRMLVHSVEVCYTTERLSVSTLNISTWKDHSIISYYPPSYLILNDHSVKYFWPFITGIQHTAISYFQNSKHSNHRVLKLDY